MKKLLVSILCIFSVLLSFAVFANADNPWMCESCGKEMTGKFCSECGSPRPDVAETDDNSANDSEKTNLILSKNAVILSGDGSETITIKSETDLGTWTCMTDDVNIATASWGNKINDLEWELTVKAQGIGATVIHVYAKNTPDIRSDLAVFVTSPSAAEIKELNKVEYIFDRRFFYYENDDYYALQFALKDASENRLSVPVTVDVRIENDDGQTVYEKTNYITKGNYGTWSNTLSGDRYVATVEIKPEDIITGTTDEGTVYFTVYQDGYVSFSESTLTTNELPKIEFTDLCSLEIYNQLPFELNYESSSGTTLYSTVKITDIQYEFEERYDKDVNLTIKFKGEKLYDYKGSGQSSSCRIGWKLYDEEGYVIKSGTCSTSNIEIGEKFKDAEEEIYSLEPGNYSIKFLDVN